MPFTEEDLSLFYPNPQLQACPDFIDNFIRVRERETKTERERGKEGETEEGERERERERESRGSLCKCGI